MLLKICHLIADVMLRSCTHSKVALNHVAEAEKLVLTSTTQELHVRSAECAISHNFGSVGLEHKGPRVAAHK